MKNHVYMKFLFAGATDIIVVEQPDGCLEASPFHVRFGKVGVLPPRARVVSYFFLFNLFL